MAPGPHTLLTVFWLSSWVGAMVLQRPQRLWAVWMEENIQLLNVTLKGKFPCIDTKVIDVFEDTQTPDSSFHLPSSSQPSSPRPHMSPKDLATLCQATSVLQQATETCTTIPHLVGLYINLFNLVHQKKCPVTGTNSIQLKKFLEKLKNISQKIYIANFQH